MSEENPICFSCKKTLLVADGPIGRSATCDSCDADIRCCLNCTFYDPNSYNECHEPSAERVVDKDRANFCDFFRLGTANVVDAKKSDDEALKKLDDLFK